MKEGGKFRISDITERRRTTIFGSETRKAIINFPSNKTLRVDSRKKESKEENLFHVCMER